MSTNPFEDRRRSARGGAAAAASLRKNRQEDAEPAIWAARHVEWPIPSALSLSNFTKLVRASKQAASTIGISDGYDNKTPRQEANNSNNNHHHHSNNNHASNEEEKNAEAPSYFGLLSRVLTSQPTEDDVPQDPTDPSASRLLRPPRTKCVATANSWMVAALECPGETSLRLVSRWNVRRMSGVDHWMALPPPCGSTENSNNNNSNNNNNNTRVMHVFCDPTGCHTLASARNGEAYYHHSSLRVMTKLPAFGCNPDGTLPSLSGIAATTASPGQLVQLGLSTGSYVTAIAWDRERGTEGSTKKILLGTNTGEIYEYSLASPNSVPDESGDDASSSNHKNPSQPILLHQLNSDGAVTGLAFERLRTGLFLMCCTSGKNKRTRFYTFYSAHSSNFKMVLADEAHASLVELPGSVDYADLRLCNDHVCMRTATGIYYGTIDRAQSGPAFAGGSMIMDSGILPYYDDDSTNKGTTLPVSLALTPHHIITLSESNEIHFFNRVAQKVIQKERVDWVGQQSNSNSSNLDESHMGVGELLMDVRRPDQVWLRKGRSLVHISPSQEDRDVWKFTLFKSLELAPTLTNTMIRSSSSSGSALQKKTGGILTQEEKTQEALFEQAKSLCTNPSQKAVVTAVRAEHHLSQGRAELAAKYLAQCPPVLEPFADTAIRLALPMLQIDDPQSYGGSPQARASLKSNLPLITYLSDKMRVGKNNNDKMTCTMIGAWLTELYLHERDSSSSNSQALSQFLTTHVHNMDAKTIMKILSSHDVSAGECAAYAASSGDIATAVNAALRVGSDTHDGVVDALKILNDAPFELAEPLYYKYASTLLSRAPVLAGKSFLSRYTHGLSPTRLLPSIMHYERLCSERDKARKVAQAAQGHNPFSDSTSSGIEESKTMSDIQFDGHNLEVQILPGVSQVGSFVYDSSVSTKYLEGVIKLGCRSSAIYSFLISLYVKLEDEEPLFKFLSAHVPAAAAASDASKLAGLYDGDSDLSGPLDMSYALRTILGTGRHFRSAIKLYMGFGMRQQAVELALKVDPSLARELAQDSVELDERKRLWLMIAKNAASESVTIGEVDVVSKVVSVLKDCGPDVMSIEDVLPFL
jgi:hypothetical protein